MKKRNMIISLISFLLLTGCSNISYELQINRKNNKQFVNFNYSDNKFEMENILKENLKENINLKNQNIEYSLDYSNVSIFNEFDNINELNNSAALYMVYNDVEVKEADNIVQVELKDFNSSLFECGEFDEDCSFVLDSVNAVVISEYKITNHNADEVDDNNNKYTWYIKNNYNKNIYFSYDINEVRWDVVIRNFIRNNFSMLIGFLLGAVALIALIALICRFIYKNKINNS